MSTTTTYQITGMTRGHCVSTVTEELSVLAIDEVRNAVDEAGYELAGIDG